MTKIEEIERSIEVLCEIENYKTQRLCQLFEMFKEFESGAEIINDANSKSFVALADAVGRLEYWKREEIRALENKKNGVVSMFEFTPRGCSE